MTRYVFVTGGVISSVGKGVLASSIGNLIKSAGYSVTNIKCDMYVNIDAGTIRPTEHGEVFVTADGIETDQDLGNYERFTNQDTNKLNYITTGQIYQEVIRRERNFEYEGEDVEVVPHVPQEIVRRIKAAGKAHNAEVVIVEFGGTVGEYQLLLFLEAARMMKLADPDHVAFVHVAYLPTPPSVGELKSKPAQYSIRSLNSAGIFPDFFIGRAEEPLDEPRKRRLSDVCMIPDDCILSCPNVESVYEVPMVLEAQSFSKKLLKRIGLEGGGDSLSSEWKALVHGIKKEKQQIRIGVVGKYFTTGDYVIGDSYICVIEAIKHAAWFLDLEPVITWFNAQGFEEDPSKVEQLRFMHGVIIPGGYGSKGIEGKIAAWKYLREQNIPALGLCLGMQTLVIDYARHVLGWADAHTEEVAVDAEHLVIHMMPHQRELLRQKQYGATNRLGNYPCVLTPGSKAYEVYGGETEVLERHRHRYEYNNEFREALEQAGLRATGTSPDGTLVELVEVVEHPFCMAAQFHPEFRSRPLAPHPLFVGVLKAAKGEL